jgi:hypothetical protein
MCECLYAQDTNKDILKRRAEEIEIKAKDLQEALSEVSTVYDVPIGVEPKLQTKKSESTKIEIALRDVTLEDTLNAIISTDSDYEWRLANDVINIYPRQNRDQILSDILDTQVNIFKLKKGTKKIEIGNLIVEIPEVKRKLIAFSITPLHFSSATTAFNSVTPEHKLEFSNVSLRDILNAIAKVSPSKSWVIFRWGSNNELLTISL